MEQYYCLYCVNQTSLYSIQNAKHHVQTFHPWHELKVGHIKGLVDPKSGNYIKTTLNLDWDTGSYLEDSNGKNNISDDENTDYASEIREEGQSGDLKSALRMPSFEKKLSIDQMSIFTSFLHMTANDSFPTTNISFLCFLDTVKLCKLPNTSMTKYNPSVKHFFGLGSRLFHGSYLRYYRRDRSYDQGTKKIKQKKE